MYTISKSCHLDTHTHIISFVTIITCDLNIPDTQ